MSTQAALAGAAVAATLWGAAAAEAQTSARYEASVQVNGVQSSQFDVTRAGVGGRFAWRASSAVGVEAELAAYPGDIPDRAAFSGGQFEGLFGVTAGPRLGAVRPFAKVRAGFARLAAAPAPIACILIFPPPLGCRLAGGATLPAVDIGGGVEVSAGRAFVRADVSDRPVRYPGPVLDQKRQVRDGPFWSHDLRIGLGVGLRF